jgi:hypothetical protein
MKNYEVYISLFNYRKEKFKTTFLVYLVVQKIKTKVLIKKEQQTPILQLIIYKK